MSLLIVMVTGSRRWPYAGRGQLGDALHEICEDHGGGDRGVLLVHGACDPRRGPKRVPWYAADPADPTLTGADWHAHHIAAAEGWAVREFPADWDAEPVRAGHIRNNTMAKWVAEHGGAVCAACWVRDAFANGTQSGAAAAKRHRLEVVDIEWDPSTRTVRSVR